MTHFVERRWWRIYAIQKSPGHIDPTCRELQNESRVGRGLNKVGIARAPNRNCIRCGQEDSIEHFFAECPAVRPLWTEVANLIAIWLGKRLTITASMILLGVEQGKLSSKESKNIDLTILIGKLCISKFKYRKQTFLKGLFYLEN